VPHRLTRNERLSTTFEEAELSLSRFEDSQTSVTFFVLRITLSLRFRKRAETASDYASDKKHPRVSRIGANASIGENDARTSIANEFRIHEGLPESLSWAIDRDVSRAVSHSKARDRQARFRDCLIALPALVRHSQAYAASRGEFKIKSGKQETHLCILHLSKSRRVRPSESTFGNSNLARWPTSKATVDSLKSREYIDSIRINSISPRSRAWHSRRVRIERASGQRNPVSQSVVRAKTLARI